MTQLSVNVNKVATLRNTRAIGIPSVSRLARFAIEAGAHGITIHPRPDQRHIRPADVYELSELVRSYQGIELNIEGNPFFEFERYARDVKPDQCTLVPDEHGAATSDHGWELTKANQDRLRPLVKKLKGFGCRVSLFMDPDPSAMQAAVDLGVDRIELYTEPYAKRFAGDPAQAVADYIATARQATALGLGINAGHDLNRENLPFFLLQVPRVLEVSIGHALIADALEFGISQTVVMYLKAIVPQPFSTDTLQEKR